MHYDNEKAFGRHTLYASVCQKRLADWEKQSGQRAGCNGAVITDTPEHLVRNGYKQSGKANRVR